MSGYQTTLQLSALAGFWIAYASNAILPQDSDLQWQIPVAVQLVPGILLLFGMSVGIVPESPVWLAGKERWGEVERSLGWLRGVDGVGEEVAVLKKGSERRESQEMEDYGEEKVSFWKEALRPAMRRRLGVGIGLMVAQNMVGLNALNYCMSAPIKSSHPHDILICDDSRRTRNLHVRWFHIHLVIPLPNRHFRDRKTTFRHCVHVCFCQDKREQVLAEARFCIMRFLDAGSWFVDPIPSFLPFSLRTFTNESNTSILRPHPPTSI